MKILHITNWYVNNFNKNEAIWIKNHIQALNKKNVNSVYHFKIIHSRGFKYHKIVQADLIQSIISQPFRQWFIIEIFYGLWLCYQLIIKKIHKDYDLVNFHIGYPMLTYWHWMKRWVKKPVVITEHWSAYHFNFGAKKELPRIQNIFQQNIPVITVSNALANDIQNFAGSTFPTYVVPNIVDGNVFFPISSIEKGDFYFMISQWKSPKTPLLAMKAFLESNQSEKRKLVIAGYGPLWDEMTEFVCQNDEKSRIRLIGSLEKEEIANYMQKCYAFLHPSDYETFSVVCAEAVSCGAYVIAPKVGGISEVVGNNGKLMSENSLDNWKDAFQQIPNTFKCDYDGRFNVKNIGQKYMLALKEIRENFEA